MSNRAARRVFSGFVFAFLLCASIGGVMLTESSLRIPRVDSTVRVAPGARLVHLAAADGATLRGTYVSAPAPVGCVLVLHGIRDSRAGATGFASAFLQEGFAVLTPDARGHGQSGGDLVTYGLLERDDVRSWASWLRGEAGCSHVFGLGESLGGASLIMAAAGAGGGGFDAIVAECSYSDLPAIARYRVGLLVGGPEWLREIVSRSVVASATIYASLRYGLDLRRAAPADAARELRIPLLLIHGLEDTRTPPEHSRRILAAAHPGTARLWEVPAAGHTTASAVAGDRFWSEVLGHFGVGQRGASH